MTGCARTACAFWESCDAGFAKCDFCRGSTVFDKLDSTEAHRSQTRRELAEVGWESDVRGWKLNLVLFDSSQVDGGPVGFGSDP
jgi:hypothetical protein